MPKKTRLHKLKIQERMSGLSEGGQTTTVQNAFIHDDTTFKKDLIKSVFFAVTISVFEIALYFIYYLRLFERR